VESNGTIPPPAWWADRIAHTTLSPKIHDQGDPASRRLKDKALAAWARQPDVAWKFVVARWWLPSAVDAQVATIRDLVKAYRIDPAAVWLMPEGTTPGVVTHGTRNLASHAIDNGWNLTTRLHTLVWHDERGH
jgi:organic radical activating enzyme